MSLLTNQSQVNSNAAFWAPASGGGGGGGGGPNPSFSTITFSTIGGTINMVGGLTFNDPTTTNGNDFVLSSGITDTAIVQGFGVGGEASILAIRAPSSITTNGGQPAISLNMGATDEVGGVIASTNPNTGLASTLYIIADKVRIPNDLLVSSINGAAPGGGGSVPANLAVSTLTINDQPTALNATLEMKSTDTNLYAIQCVSSSVGLAEVQLGYVGGRNQFYTAVGEVDQCFVSSLKGVADPIPILSGVTVTGPLYATASPVNISSLTVSSINGALPGTGNGGAIGVQSIPDTGAVSLVCDAPGGAGNPTAITTPLGISTVLAHTYTYTAEASIQAGPNQTGEAQIQLEFGNNTRFYDQVRYVSTIVGPNKVVSLNWRFIATGTGGNAIYGYAWDPLSNAASTTVILQKQSLTDYGIIL